MNLSEIRNKIDEKININEFKDFNKVGASDDIYYDLAEFVEHVLDETMEGNFSKAERDFMRIYAQGLADNRLNAESLRNTL